MPGVGRRETEEVGREGKERGRAQPGKGREEWEVGAHARAGKAVAEADKTAATALDKAPQRQTIRVVGIKNHECKIVKERIKIVKGEETEVSKFVYDVLTNPELPGPIVKAVF